MILTDDDILHSAASTLGEMHVENCGLGDIKDFARHLEAKWLAKLAGMELPEPETFEAWNAKQHCDPEEIGFLQALRIAYCCGQDSANQRQAFAQGAASQLADKPFAFVRSSQLHFGHVACDESDDGAFPLFTRKEAK